jgi:predicted GNAT superfamily acetyltransferase
VSGSAGAAGAEAEPGPPRHRPGPAGHEAGVHGGDPGLVIRPLAGLAEREACVALQERVWGDAFADRVPASVLMIALETGGVASGAFLDGRLVGFVFGITGVRDGRPIHWSDMLAVAPEHRGQGIGFRLKVHQRALLLERGVDVARWTFDPLEARNAHLNLERLGAVVREYRRDVYGTSDSPLHAGIGTDRLVADWPLASDRVRRHLTGEIAEGVPTDDAPVLNPPVAGAGGGVRPSRRIAEPEAPVVRLAVPADIQALKRADLARAVAWRANVRAAFERAFEAGYTGVGVERGGAGRAGEPVFYILARGFSS